MVCHLLSRLPSSRRLLRLRDLVPKPGEEKGASPKASGLQGVIAQRVAPEPADSALKIRKANASKKKKKDKKRAKRQAEKERKRARKGEERKADDSSDESSSTTSSSSDSLFRLAALPQGTDRLQRLHQEI